MEKEKGGSYDQKKRTSEKIISSRNGSSMTMSLLPGTALADATSGVLADGTYESTAHVTRTAEDDEDENAWDEYDVNVKITVADGKFSDIAVTPGSGYNTEMLHILKKQLQTAKDSKRNFLEKMQRLKTLKDGILYRVQPELRMQ